MRIVHQDADRLVLERRPVALAAAMGLGLLVIVHGALQNFGRGETGGGVLFLAGAAILLLLIGLFVQFDRADFDRGAGEVRLIRRTLLGSSRQSLPLADIARVEMQTTGDTGAKQSPAHRPVLILKSGAAPLRLHLRHVRGGGTARAVAAANAWLGA